MARVQRIDGTEVRGFPSDNKENGQPRLLSQRDKRIVDCLLSGKTEEQAGAQFGLSQQRVNQIQNTPAAQAYIIGKAANRRGQVNAIALDIVHKRLMMALQTNTEYTISIDDLIKVIRVTTPKIETSEAAYEMLYAEAERIANDVGLSGDRRRQFFQWLRENAA